MMVYHVPAKGFAAVNIREGSYHLQEVDFKLPLSGYTFQIERKYSSRSSQIGLFGFGWCSNIEPELTRLDPLKFILRDCNISGEIIFDRNNDRSPLLHGINRESESLRIANGKIFRKIQPGVDQVFDLESLKLLEIKVHNSSSVYFKYNPDHRLYQIILPHQKIIHIDYINVKSGRRKIAKLSTVFGTPSHYQYIQDNLISVKGHKDSQYTYNQYHNLTEYLVDKSRIETTSYDDKKDRVEKTIQFESGNSKCVENFNYFEATSQLTVSTDTTCKGKQTQFKKYRFLYSGSTTQNRFLSRLLISSNGSFIEYSFHELTGRLLLARQKQIELESM